MIETARKTYPNFKAVATTLRNAKTATKNDWGEQKCQASSDLPQNFGVCVGPLK